MIERTFQDIPEGKISEADQHSYLVSLGWYRGDTWEGLLRSKRILIVSEAGGGKTHECQSLCKQLFESGQAAFYLELASLASNDLRDMLEPDHETRFDEWLVSQSEVATFFLDSFDELKLSKGSFDLALKRLRKAIGGNLGRTRIVITTRPIPFDEKLIRKLLPVPETSEYEANSETFAQIALHGTAGLKKSDGESKAPDWRKVALIPLSDDQILAFAASEKVDNPKSLLDDLKKRNAEEFARRPQDLIELCADWRIAKRIRNHREQVKANIRIKLKPRDDRAEPADLSVDKATKGASRLALAMIFMRRFTIRHSAEADQGIDEAAIDPTSILPDWTEAEQKALLERPLFGFASYGRVRFHHRSVMEYLAADRLHFLQSKGMPSRALRRLLFAETRGKIVARPSKRPVAAWLALDNEMVFETLRDHEPGVLLEEGDPESLSLQKRCEALRKFVRRYGHGGWRGLNIPAIQVNRFSSPDLAETINGLWEEGIDNTEVSELLLGIISSGKIIGCSDIAFRAAYNLGLTKGERIDAVVALAEIGDSRIKNLVNELSTDPKTWPHYIAKILVTRLFPRNMPVEDLLPDSRMRRRAKGQNWRLCLVFAPHNRSSRVGDRRIGKTTGRTNFAHCCRAEMDERISPSKLRSSASYPGSRSYMRSRPQ